MPIEEGLKGGEMRIAILGWGSLLWEGGPEFDKWHGGWAQDGPKLRLEFSRISKRRLGALTLVVDNEHGTLTTVAWCLSQRAKLEDAICDLRAREGTTLDQIDRISNPSSPLPSATSPAAKHIERWARTKGLDAVIWTALSSNFAEKTGQEFSTAAGIAYLMCLEPEAKVKAAEYIWRSPNFVKTPLRTSVQVPPWFTPSSRRGTRKAQRRTRRRK